MNLNKLLVSFSSILKDPTLYPLARILPSSFTRKNGKMPLHYLLTYLIFRHGKTLSEDISTIYSGMNNLKQPTKQAVLKRMSILNFDVWYKIQQLFIERIYLPMKKKTLNGYLLIAIDGTFATLPDHPVLGLKFGRHRSYNNNNGSDPQAKISIAYDVLNHMILDFRITHQDTSEIPLMFQHLEALEETLKNYKVILLMDRYYGSSEFFKYCEMKGYKYIVRAKSNFFKKQRALIPDECKDTILDVLIDELWQKRIIRENIRNYIIVHPRLFVRLVKAHYEYNQEYINFERKKYIKQKSVETQYFTNLPNEEFKTEIIINIYHRDRWCIETEYGNLKNLLNLEQVNSANPIVILNELMAKIIYSNIENLVRNTCEERNKHDDNHIVNNKKIVELCRSAWFIRAFFKCKFHQRKTSELIKECARHKILVRAGRHYKRWDKFRISAKQQRYRMDGRNNPPLKITKAGIMTSNK